MQTEHGSENENEIVKLRQQNINDPSPICNIERVPQEKSQAVTARHAGYT